MGRRLDRAAALMIPIALTSVVAGGTRLHAQPGGPAPGSIPSVTMIAVPYSALPGWREDDHAAAFRAFRRSCGAVAAREVGSGSDEQTGRLAAICRLALARGHRRMGRSEARLFFEHHFVPHRVRHAVPHGLLTGYYEPHIDGSRVATARFRVPLYRRPPDLENVVAESERARSGVPLTYMRRTASGLEPYATRAEIEAGALAGRGLELLWLADPVDAFFAQVQGSARVRLPDGTRVGIGYDGKNGHPYTSIGRVLIDRGAMTAAEMSMERLGMWLRADEARGREVMRHNASFVFFRELGANEGHSALGGLGTPLTPGRSLAVDTAFHRLGSPVYVDAPELRHWGRRRPFRRLMVAEDVGSAIRGPERGDIYFGSGAQAGARAGITKHPGNFHVLLPRGPGKSGPT